MNYYYTISISVYSAHKTPKIFLVGFAMHSSFNHKLFCFPWCCIAVAMYIQITICLLSLERILKAHTNLFFDRLLYVNQSVILKI